MSEYKPLHAGAWAMWLAAIVAALAVTRNPIYIGLILGWITVVWWTAKSVAHIMNPDQAIPLSPLRFGLFVVPVSAVFNALMIPVGEHVLFRLPGGWLLIGGAFTLEALVFGALNGLVLTGLYAAFILVNRVLSTRDIVRLVPRAYHSVAIVVSIAATYVPATLRQYKLIREAQTVRGHRLKGVRTWLPLLIPLLTGGMERALQLAESMTARGYASVDESRTSVWMRVGMVAGLVIFTAGLLLRLAWQQDGVGMALLAVGAIVLVGAVWLAGRSHSQTVYRPSPWRLQDWIVTAGALLTMAAFLYAWPGMDRSSIYYYPYPSLALPGFSLWIGVGTWGLLVPAMIMMADRLQIVGEDPQQERSQT